jgi:DNA-binding response OmpR family regulator
LRWPTEDHARIELELQIRPCLLLLEPDVAPPELWGELEDWVRLPLDPDELRARTRSLRRRARAMSRPWFDVDGLLRVEDGWIDLPAAPAAVARLLVERFGAVVDANALAKAYLEVGGSPAASAQKAMIVRLRQRLTELGLELHNVRDVGYLLAWTADAGDDAGATRTSCGCVAS